MKIKCTLSIKDENINSLVKSINPENNPLDSKGSYIISYMKNTSSITYSFSNFEKISTLRLTLEDLLSHLEFSKTISERIKNRIEKEDK